MPKRLTYLKNSYDDPKWSFVIAVLALFLAYGAGSWALDTGSWLLYIATFALIAWAFNRLGHTVIYLVKGGAKKA